MIHIKNKMPSCCGRAFKDVSALEQHQEAKRHHRCNQCDRSFGKQASLDQHNRDLHLHGQLPKQNKDSDRYCGECQKSFVNAAALAQHRHSAAHAVEFRCCDCERNFIDLDALNQHLKDKVHKKPKAPSVVKGMHQCPKCPSQFHTEEALRSHASSVVHRARNLVCAIGGGGSGGCTRLFRSPSAMLHHLESGACPSGMDRATLNMLVLKNDTERIVSSSEGAVRGLLREATLRLGSERTTPRGIAAARVIDTGIWDDEEEVLTQSSGSASGGVILTPSSTMMSSLLASPLLTPSSDNSSATIIARAPDATRCPLCPPTRRPFSTPQALQQHLLSPAHDAQIFHCPLPNSRFAVSGSTALDGGVAAKWFSTLSGMGQHVESGACVGSGTDFNKAVKCLETRMRGLGLAVRRAQELN